MKDEQLKFMHGWRFVNIRKGEKIPEGLNWQKNPCILTEIYTDNIGVILGPASNGLCAIDFDGEEAIDHFNQTFPHIDITSIDTPMWTSGKDYRFQAAFTVPEEYWIHLKRKVVNKLEFRWANTQSILPPSTLNDGRTYTWIKSPRQVPVQQLSDDILAYWLTLMYEEMTRYDNIPVQQYELSTFDEEFVNILLEKIARKVGTLRGDYDVWRTIAWATCSAVGISSAKMLMQFYWPDKTKKEMSTLLAWKHGVGPKIGTLIKLSGISTTERQILELEMKIRKM
jgi:hypothetical protein